MAPTSSTWCCWITAAPSCCPTASKRQSLYCIRCGACLNTCPVYRKIGGHSFPWVYSGPIGAIITPQFMGVSHEPALPFASSLCGACGEVCPVKIDIPKVLLELRSDVKKAEAREKQNRLEKLAFRVFAWLMTHPRLYEMAGRMGASLAPSEDGGWIRSVPAHHEFRPGEGLAEPARSAAAARQKLPRNVETALMSRDNILHRIRTAVGRSAGQPPAEPPPVRIRVPEMSLQARIASTIARVEALAGKAVHTSDPRAYVAEAIAGKTAVASNAPFLAECGITSLPGVRSGITDHEELRALCATADIGITSADYVLADTGTLVLLSSPREARLISLLPPAHLAVVPRERILTGLDELLAVLPNPAVETSSMVLITGPSRTADIEQILVRGVHGPGQITVVIAD